MTQQTRKRGRPRKILPFFDDPIEEEKRLAKCLKEGRDPYPRFKHVPCDAERELLESVMPWVSFDMVLSLNNCDDYGRSLPAPKAEAAWDLAQVKRQQAAKSGAALKPRPNRAATMVFQHQNDIVRWAEAGLSRSAVYTRLASAVRKLGQQPVGRTQFYKELGSSGIWPAKKVSGQLSEQKNIGRS